MYQNGWSSITFACGRGHMDVIKLLMDRGANINLQNKASNRFSYIVVAPVMFFFNLPSCTYTSTFAIYLLMVFGVEGGY